MTSAESAAPAGISEVPYLRVAELLDRVGGDRGLLARMVELFAVDSSAQFQRARAALANRDGGSLSRCAHTLKGAVGNFSAPTVQDLAVAFEVEARAGEWERVSALLTTFETHTIRMIAEVRGLARVPQATPGTTEASLALHVPAVPAGDACPRARPSADQPDPAGGLPRP